ncbi:MAG: MerR family transcriptional regulator, partial [Thermus aquaticus]
DIERLREIRRLTQELGVNLAGVEEIMRLRAELEALQARFEAEVTRLRLLLLEEGRGLRESSMGA